MRRWIPTVLAFAACSGSPGTEPSPAAPNVAADSGDAADTGDVADTDAPSATVDGPAVFPERFELVQARVTEPDGTECELCLWLADDAERRARGLMFATDLGPADGMAFRYPESRTGNFWMKNTLLPLSIAFYDATGVYLDAFDMDPCESDPCPRYRTAPNFLVAVETLQGGLPDIGMVPGSTLELLDVPCS